MQLPKSSLLELIRFIVLKDRILKVESPKVPGAAQLNSVHNISWKLSPVATRDSGRDYSSP